MAELARQLPASSDLQSAGLQALAQAGFDDELRREIAVAQTGARCALAAVVLDVPEVAPGSEEERGVGFIVYSLVTGLVAQALMDQHTVREPDLLARAVRALT
ncbi:hypothetical protein GCM10023169_30340 [Georgenia halophila]|uniref:Uncharacterized protein n=1 Tax=Georgenia halophila TaxID=620889 RepID=A0ABP8LHC5_9MICO